MKQKFKTIIIIISIITWLFLIFYMSSMNVEESTSKSKGIIYQIVDTTLSTCYKLNITNNEPTHDQIQNITNKLNYPLRKCMHMTEYFILNLLIIILLINISKKIPIKPYLIPLISILLCFVYAATDEYHQTLITGRTGQFSDVIIDTTGATISSGFYLIFYKKQTKNLKNDKKTCKI